MTGMVIIGAGGHGKVLADIFLQQQQSVQGFVDDNPALCGTEHLGLPVLGVIDSVMQHKPTGLAMGVGINTVRQAIVQRLGANIYYLWRQAIHPRAVVAPSAQIGVGVVICANAVVNPDSIIGDFAIINTGATVDHDCVIGPYAHVAPGAHLAGGIRVGEGTLIGVGSALIPGCVVGEWATVGAGTVVTNNIPDHVTAMGVPARWFSAP